MNGIVDSRSVNEPVPATRPAPPREPLKATLDAMLGEDDRDPAGHRRQGGPHRQHGEGGLPARPQARARDLPQGRAAKEVRAGHRRGAARRGKTWARDAAGRTAPRSSSRRPTCSPARGATRSTPRPCSARARPSTRPRSTRPAS